MELQQELIVKKRNFLGVVSFLLCLFALFFIVFLFIFIGGHAPFRFESISTISNAFMFLAFVLSIIDIRNKDSAKIFSKITFTIGIIYYSLYLTTLAVMVVGMIII